MSESSHLESSHLESCHLIVEGNPAIVYASRRGSPDKVLAILMPFLETFWQERDTSGEASDTPECLVAQIVVRFGFEICEDDFSNLKVGVEYHPEVDYLYSIAADRRVHVWTPEASYRQNPAVGLAGCREISVHEVEAASV
ncbi:histidine kinase [Leptolyngbya ohadii]|uniref:histidine kinase n=1 Tax=Leptolyngbya ohadii TaxID=1962290 RepID=UPI000B59EBFC|nr:histidine kinase [Leptolyngbya ohadii]